jgi:flagellar biosynthesis protein FlhB
MSDQRTEAPTPRRIEEARRKGEPVGRSHELVMAATLGTGILALTAILPGAALELAIWTRAAITAVGQGSESAAALTGQLGRAFAQSVVIVIPLAAVVVVAGILSNMAGGGLILSFGSVRFDFSRLNPITGFKRLFDKSALVRLGTAVAKLAILTFVSWRVVSNRVPTLIGVNGASAGTIAGAAMDAIFDLGLMVSILLALVGIGDFVIQRRRTQGRLRMTKDEVRRENKDSEGDPHVRSFRRRRARQMAFARMMDAVPTADVIVTNPTHLAIALKYEAGVMRAPKIVAKGQRLTAERIRQIAREHGVPIVEDKPLARALFTRPLGSEVPPHLYRAVARILVLVHRARFGERRAHAPAPPPAPRPRAIVPTLQLGAGDRP